MCFSGFHWFITEKLFLRDIKTKKQCSHLVDSSSLCSWNSPEIEVRPHKSLTMSHLLSHRHTDIRIRRISWSGSVDCEPQKIVWLLGGEGTYTEWDMQRYTTKSEIACYKMILL